MSKSSILFVGLDVHKESIDLAVAGAPLESAVRHMGGIGGDPAARDKALRWLISAGHELRVVHEAGPCGFVLARHVAARGGRTAKWSRPRRSPNARETA